MAYIYSAVLNMAVPKLLLDVFGDMTTTGEMVRRFTFWRAFLCLAFLGAVGNSFISFARDLTVSVGASASLAAALLGSLPLCIVGLCLSGLSYGSSPTFSSAFTAAFYGSKYFFTNFSVMDFNLVVASLMATASSALLTAFGGFAAPFVLLLALAVAGLALNLSVKRP